MFASPEGQIGTAVFQVVRLGRGPKGLAVTTHDDGAPTVCHSVYPDVDTAKGDTPPSVSDLSSGFHERF